MISLKEGIFLKGDLVIGSVKDGKAVMLPSYRRYFKEASELLESDVAEDDLSWPEDEPEIKPETVKVECDEIPAAPAKDHRGDKTPEFVAWMDKYHPAEAEIKYRSWRKKENSNG